MHDDGEQHRDGCVVSLHGERRPFFRQCYHALRMMIHINGHQRMSCFLNGQLALGTFMLILRNSQQTPLWLLPRQMFQIC
jgi:hypothetical protein